MAFAQVQDAFDEQRRRRTILDPAPAESVPMVTPTASPAVPSTSTPQHVPTGTQTDQGWMYPELRPEPYQNELSPREIGDQLILVLPVFPFNARELGDLSSQRLEPLRIGLQTRSIVIELNP